MSLKLFQIKKFNKLYRYIHPKLLHLGSRNVMQMVNRTTLLSESMDLNSLLLTSPRPRVYWKDGGKAGRQPAWEPWERWVGVSAASLSAPPAALGQTLPPKTRQAHARLCFSDSGLAVPVGELLLLDTCTQQAQNIRAVSWIYWVDSWTKAIERMIRKSGLLVNEIFTFSKQARELQWRFLKRTESYKEWLELYF